MCGYWLHAVAFLVYLYHSSNLVDIHKTLCSYSIMLVVNIYTKPKIKRFKNIKNEKNNIELFQYINVRLSEPIQNLIFFIKLGSILYKNHTFCCLCKLPFLSHTIPNNNTKLKHTQRTAILCSLVYKPYN